MPATPKPRPDAFGLEVATLLRERMARLGISQTALAEDPAITSSQSQLSKQLRGERPITLDELDALCMALGLHIDQVVTQADEATRGRRQGSMVQSDYDLAARESGRPILRAQMDDHDEGA